MNVKNDSIRYTQVQEMIDFARSKTRSDLLSPIIIAGDFNAPARSDPTDGSKSSAVYMEMMNLMNSTFSDHQVQDALRDAAGEHPVTYGDVIVDEETGERRPRELVLTNAADYCCQLSIDYLIWLSPRSEAPAAFPDNLRYSSSSNDDMARQLKAPAPRLVPASTRVEPFFIDPSVGPYQFAQLSDHYGISATLRV